MTAWHESTCVECGEKMPAGQTNWCKFGGLCSHYVPRAVRARLEFLANELKSERGTYMNQSIGDRKAENLRVRLALQDLQSARGALELSGHQKLSARLTKAIQYLTERKVATDVNDNASRERRGWTA